MKVTFVTVSDMVFFPGTLATVNSILRYHPNDTIYVISSGEYNEPLSDIQIELLEKVGVIVLNHEDFYEDGRVPGAWQLKAYSMYDIAKSAKSNTDVFIGIDSDAVLCSNIGDIIKKCSKDGKFRGGKDGNGVVYDSSYSPYGFNVPCKNDSYMSTSMYVFTATEENIKILEDWANCCNEACFGPQEEKVYPGHGDQGVLNAVIYKNFPDQGKVETLENKIFSQHWTYASDIIDYQDENFINVSFNKEKMRMFHSSCSTKWWLGNHNKKAQEEFINQVYPYAYFLYLVFFGEASSLRIDPFEWIDGQSRFLLTDVVNYFRIIQTIGGKDVDEKWSKMGVQFLERMTDGIDRSMQLRSSMSSYIDIVRSLNVKNPKIAEIGSYHGGSIITLAIATMDILPTVFSIETFTGNLDNTVDGHPLPSKKRYFEQIRKYDSVGVTLIQLDSFYASNLFDNEFFDFVLIDANHSEEHVKKDIESWYPKIKENGIMAGNDFNWESVKNAVNKFFKYEANSSNGVWWIKK